jgi:hypothetical protein
MGDVPAKTPPVSDELPEGSESAAAAEEKAAEKGERGLSDLVRRAVSAGVGAASRGKEDIMRAAATEMRGWLDRLDLDGEIVRALSQMTIEIKAEIRFKPNEDGTKLIAETSTETTTKRK